MSSHAKGTCPRSCGTALFVFSILALLPFALLAQYSRGSLRGIVNDASGAAVPGAKIVVKADGSSLQREATSDSRGEFRLDDLPPGNYQARVSAPGLAEANANVKVIISSVQQITVTLKPETIQQSVNVQGRASSITTQSIDTASAVHQTVITSQDLSAIPLAARSFANIAYLAPGTEPVEPSDPTKARITAVSTGGSSAVPG